MTHVKHISWVQAGLAGCTCFPQGEVVLEAGGGQKVVEVVGMMGRGRLPPWLPEGGEGG